jgi:hypothetical protein
VPREIKLATFNVEWMVHLFEPNRPELLTGPNKHAAGAGAKPQHPQGVANRIAAVIKAVDADILGICEGPPLKSQMQEFVAQKLDDDYRVYSMEDGPQSVHALVHKRVNHGVTITQLSRNDKVYDRLRTVRTFYKFGDVKGPQRGRFTRLPVILRLKRKGRTTDVMIVHTKSKLSALTKPSQWEKKDRDAVISAILARQKLSIEMNVIRKYIAHRLYSKNAQGVIVMGDLNDGVTRDIVDENYLLHSAVHELRGAFHHELALMRHVLNGRQLQRKKDAWTAKFEDPHAGGRNRRVLLDHIIFSPACHDGGKVRFVTDSGLVEHAAYDRHVAKKGESRDERPSDHKPVSARFALR